MPVDFHQWFTVHLLTGQKAILFGICPMAACYFQLCPPPIVTVSQQDSLFWQFSHSVHLKVTSTIYLGVHMHKQEEGGRFVSFIWRNHVPFLLSWI